MESEGGSKAKNPRKQEPGRGGAEESSGLPGCRCPPKGWSQPQMPRLQAFPFQIGDFALALPCVIYLLSLTAELSVFQEKMLIQVHLGT